MDDLPEFRLIEFLVSSRVPQSAALEEVHVLLLCDLRVLREEATRVVKVRDHGLWERAELFGLREEALIAPTRVPFL